MVNFQAYRNLVLWWHGEPQGYVSGTFSGIRHQRPHTDGGAYEFTRNEAFLGFLRLELGKGIQEHETDISTKQN